MYHEHFGLERAPFRITPDTELFYPGGGRGEVLEALVYAVTSGEGIVKVTGEVGTGKTMLCRMLEVRLPSSVEVVYIANPSLSPEDILHAIALEMNLPLDGTTNRLTVMHSLQQRLLEMHAQNRRVVVFVEEAQGMPMETLEEIRLLSNLETQRDKLLQIVLFGQPELDEALDRSSIRQLRERITHSFRLEPLSRDEVREYVRFRMRAVGYRGPDVFKEGAYRQLARASEGLVRRINILSDKALLAAFADDTHNVSTRHMNIAVEDGNFGVRRNRRVWWLAGVAVLLTALVGTMFALDSLPWQQWLQRYGLGESTLVRTSPGPRPPPAAVPASSDIAEQQLPATAPVVAAPAVAAVPVPAPAPPVTPAAAPMSGAVERTPVIASAVVVAASEQVAPVGMVVAAPPAAAGGTTVSVSSPPVERPAATPPGPDPADDAASAPADVPRTPAAVQQAVVDVVDSAPVVTSARSTSAAGTMPAAEASQAGPVANTAAPVVVPASPAAVASPPAPAVVVASGPETPPAPAVTSVNSENLLLAQRVTATTDWLQSARGSNLCIQLLLADVARQGNLETFLEQMRRLGVLERIYVYETVIGARSWFGVLYGDFGSFDEAREALQALPDELRRHKPFIRNVRDIVGQI